MPRQLFFENPYIFFGSHFSVEWKAFANSHFFLLFSFKETKPTFIRIHKLYLAFISSKIKINLQK